MFTANMKVFGEERNVEVRVKYCVYDLNTKKVSSQTQVRINNETLSVSQSVEFNYVEGVDPIEMAYEEFKKMDAFTDIIDFI